MKNEYNIARNAADIVSVSAMFVCKSQSCDRTIVEYGEAAVPSRHSRGLPKEVTDLMQIAGKLTLVNCDHHGGDAYIVGSNTNLNTRSGE